MCAFWSKLLNVPTEPEPRKFKDPVFLIGLMRSGTTMLVNILSEHPQLLKVGFELNDIWTKIGGAPSAETCLVRTELDFKQEYANNMTAYFADYINESKKPIRHLARWSQKRYYGSGRIFYDWDNLYVLNKSPHLSNKIRYLNKMFPNAKFVVLIRDIYGQSASLKMHFQHYNNVQNYYFELPIDESSGWTNHLNPDLDSLDSSRLYPNTFKVIPQAWIRLHKIILSHLEVVPKQNKVILKYEDLVSNRGETIQKIFDFLSLEKKYDKEIHNTKSKKRKIHSTFTQGSPLEKWKSHLSSEEVDIIREFESEANLLKNKFFE